MGNAGVLLFFANADMSTLEWLSKRLGQTEVVRETVGRSDSATTSTSRSQGVTQQSGWSRSSGQSEGRSEMPELQSLSARDGGNGLVPFLARANASGTGTNTGWQSQNGETGGESVQQGDSSSAGKSETASRNEAIHLVPLMTPDEIARAFDRKTGRQIVLIDGRAVALTRMNYDSEGLP